jgi:hypothetical protein
VPTNADIVAKAREYINTPFAPKGRAKGSATDCVGLVLMVAGELDLKDVNGVSVSGSLYSDYSDQPLGNYVHEACMRHLVYVPVRLLKPGNVVTVSLGTAPCHVGIIGSDKAGALTLIHAYNGGSRLVIEQPIDTRWLRRFRGGFAFPEVKE